MPDLAGSAFCMMLRSDTAQRGIPCQGVKGAKNMMKKCCLLWMILILCLAGSTALAVDGTILSGPADPNAVFTTMSDMAVVGDTIYFHTYQGTCEEIWYWREDMAQAEMLATGFVRGSDYVTIEAAEQAVGAEKAKYAFVEIFSDGERLLALNHLNGLIFEIAVEDGTPVCRDVVTLQANYMFYRDYDTKPWFWRAQGIAAVKDCMYWASSGSTEVPGEHRERITCFSLTDGSFHDIEMENVRAICAYKEDDLLILSRPRSTDQENGKLESRLSVYDPETGTITVLRVLDGTTVPTAIAYAPELDVVLYQKDMCIMGIGATGEPALYANVYTTGCRGMDVVGDTLVINVLTVIARTLSEDHPVTDTLQIMNSGFTAAHRSFVEKHPDIVLEKLALQGSSYADAFLPVEGKDVADVLKLESSHQNASYQELVEKGMLLDLSQDAEIAAYVSGLYPAFREYVTGENGEIWAIPVSTSSYSGFFINRRAMTELGLTQEEMPANLVELCAFATRWNDEFAEKYPNYALFEYTENARAFLLEMIVEQWMVYCQATGQELHWDDPVFRELLAALEQVRADRTDASMQVTNPEESDYKTGLFWLNCQLVGNWAPYMEAYSDRIFVPMTLTADTPFIACVGNVNMWVINRYTDSPETAMGVLREEIAGVSDKYAHVLLTTRTEPVENPYYAREMAEHLNVLANLEAELAEETDAEKRERLQAEADGINAEIQRARYSIAPSAIENYVNVLAPALHIRLDADENRGDVSLDRAYRWLEGTIGTEQFIREMELEQILRRLPD